MVLALIALGALRNGLAFATAAVWLFNLAGTADLIYANVSTFVDKVDPTMLGVSYYLAVVNVPAMIVVHILIFLHLLRRRSPAHALRST